MTAETDIAAIDDSGANTAAEVRTALTSVLARTWDKVFFSPNAHISVSGTPNNQVLNSRWGVLAFDATNEEGASFAGFVLPDTWATATLWIAWTTASGSGDVMWGGNLDEAADGESTAVTGPGFDNTTITAPTANLVSIDQIGSAVAVDPTNDVMNLRLFRRGNNAADTLGADALLVAVWLERAS